jgi:hypothetical protein
MCDDAFIDKFCSVIMLWLCFNPFRGVICCHKNVLVPSVFNRTLNWSHEVEAPFYEGFKRYDRM